jgi:hypothetical protein
VLHPSVCVVMTSRSTFAVKGWETLSCLLHCEGGEEGCGISSLCSSIEQTEIWDKRLQLPNIGGLGVNCRGITIGVTFRRFKVELLLLKTFCSFTASKPPALSKGCIGEESPEVGGLCTRGWALSMPYGWKGFMLNSELKISSWMVLHARNINVWWTRYV